MGGLIYRHRRGHPADRPPAFPQHATWGALGAEWMTRPIDEPWANVPPPKEAVDWDAIIDAGTTTRQPTLRRRRPSVNRRSIR